MKCQNCSHEQAAGKFCGKCGNPLLAGADCREEQDVPSTFENSEPVVKQPGSLFLGSTAALPNSLLEQAQPIEKMKGIFRSYRTYYFTYLKNPSGILRSSSSNFSNALVTIGIFIVIVSLLIHNMIGYAVAFLNSITPQDLFSAAPVLIPAPALIEVMGNMLLYFGILFALTFASLFLTTKFLGTPTPLKQLVTAIGTLLIPVSLLLASALVFLVVGLRGVGNGFFFMGLITSFLVIPVYAITGLNRQEPQKFDPLFASIAYTGLFLTGSYVFFSWLIKSRINEALAVVKEVFSILL